MGLTLSFPSIFVNSVSFFPILVGRWPTSSFSQPRLLRWSRCRSQSRKRAPGVSPRRNVATPEVAGGRFWQFHVGALSGVSVPPNRSRGREKTFRGFSSSKMVMIHDVNTSLHWRLGDFQSKMKKWFLVQSRFWRFYHPKCQHRFSQSCCLSVMQDSSSCAVWGPCFGLWTVNCRFCKRWRRDWADDGHFFKNVPSVKLT